MEYAAERHSAIFNKSVKNFDDLHNLSAKCSETITAPPWFSNSEYKEVILVLTKKGELTWNIPGHHSLSCYDPSLAKTKFISFSGYERYNVSYITDCITNG